MLQSRLFKCQSLFKKIGEFTQQQQETKIICSLKMNFFERSSQSSKIDVIFDPDESTLIRMLSENMKEWDTPVDIEKLKSEFSSIDSSNENVLTERQVFN
jgi:hypothetical protein